MSHINIAEALLSTSGLTTRDAAIVFAQVGIPIFPCVAHGKRPLTHAGFLEATSDIVQIGAWWAQWPMANIGMPTGSESGIEVLDVDVTRAASGFAAFDSATAAGLLEGEIARVRTPSRGMHVYFPAMATRPQRCWQVASAHIDFRADGGYVVVPPSTLQTDNGRVRYRLSSVSTASSKPVDAIALRDFISPPPPPRRPQGRGVDAPVEADRLAHWVTRLQEGERNRGLFWAACRLSEAGFAPAAVEAMLAPAAQTAGLPAWEISATISSAGRQITAGPPRTAEATWFNRNASRKESGETPCLP
ncbi:MAG: bifunctional DNA primase/polymerase [Microbacterium sp.]